MTEIDPPIKSSRKSHRFSDTLPPNLPSLGRGRPLTLEAHASEANRRARAPQALHCPPGADASEGEGGR